VSGLPDLIPSSTGLIGVASSLSPRSTAQPQSGAPRSAFASQLLAWYDANARDLPWRKNRDPYRVWLSEIMLQQTRVAAVLGHYRRFLKRFPTIQKLAAARESSVLAAWSGLGYYRRARMLHAAARLVAKERGGIFPRSSAELRGLPGIGRYTAAAIASIAFQEPVVVVDGNVERVVSRLTGAQLVGKEAWRKAGELLDPARPGDFNQAIMELGATVCLPRQPRCLLCPLTALCATRGELPAGRPRERQRKRTVCFALARRAKQVLLVQRSEDDSLMAGFWELPQVALKSGVPIAFSLRHSITVTDYTVQVIELARPAKIKGKWVPVSRISSLPLTGLARKILRRAEVL
jgi:A/G-specific adenine glycosylase